MSKSWVSLVVVLAALEAHAQYVAAPLRGVPYPELTSFMNVTLTVDGGVPNADRGRATLALGFQFPFYARTYSSLTVTANGMAFFEPDGDNNANYLLNFAIPNTSPPNGLLAPWWDDLNGNNAGSAVRQQTVTGPNGRGLAIEWHDWNREYGSYSLSFQLRLWEDGIIEFFYATMEGNGAAVSATIGIESPTGGSGTAPFACGALCDLTTLSTPSTDGGAAPPQITYIKFGPPAGIDLQALALRVTAISDAGAGTLGISSELTARNFGTVTSPAFTARMFLSQDTILDGFDVELTPSPTMVSGLGPNESRALALTGQVAKPASGPVYVLAVVDAENAAGEHIDRSSNNLAATPVPYSAGVDLVAERITAPLSTGPGDLLTVAIAFTNQGFEAPSQPVSVKVYASVDARFDATDRLLTSATFTVAGGESVRRSLTFTMPASVTADTYYLGLQLDGDPGVIVEASKTNNFVFSQTKMTVRQPDLVMGQVTVRRAQAPFEETATAFFGELIRIDAQVQNQGGSPASNVSVQFFLSDNETLNGLSDATVGSVLGLSLAAGETKPVTLTALVPSRSPSNQVLQTQPYFFFAAALAPGLGETNVANNASSSVPTLVRGPAANVLPLSVQSPARIGAGEIAAIARTLANFGNRPANAVSYRYYLSANTRITNEDLLLLMVNADGGTVEERTIDLPVNAQDTATEWVRVPASASSATMYVGVLVDPEGTLDESSKDDNGLAGQAVQVAGQSLQVITTQLPDAIAGQPYWAGLVATEPNVSWAAPAGVPAGLVLSESGVLSGVAAGQGVMSFTADVSAANRRASGRVTIRVVAATGPLTISTTSLDAPVRGLAYAGQLGAAGGSAPYSWTVSSGELPVGLVLASGGGLSGTANAPLGTSSTFVITVRDAVGTSNSRAFTLVTLDASPLQIIASALPDGVVGNEYLSLLAVRNASGAPVSTPISWRITNGAVPSGISLEASTAGTVALSGVPTTSGLFSFRIEAVDARGRVARLNTVVSVYGPAVKIAGEVPSTVTLGDSISVKLAAVPAQPDAMWVVRDGRLPSGVTLSGDGLLSGSVAALGSSTFTVGLGSSRASLRALATYRIDVVSNAAAPKSGGCSSVDGLGLFVLAAAVLSGFSRRVRR